MNKNREIQLDGRKVSFRQFFEKYGMLCILLLFCLVLSVVSESFFTWGNWQNLIRQVCVNGILALGMTFVILTGGIDLSVGPLCAVAGVVAAKFMVDNPNAPVIVPILLAFGVCLIFGIFYGSIISWSGLPPFVVTLAVMQIARGLALAYTDGKPIIIKNEVFRFLGQGKLFGVIPIPVLFFLAIFLYSLFIQRHTKFGRYIYAIGGNENAAKASGVNVRKYRTLPCVVMNLSVESEDYSAYVGVYDVYAGEMMGNRISELLGGKGKIVILEGELGQGPTILRDEGLDNTILKEPGIELLERKTANWSRDTAMSITEDLLTSHSDIDAILCHNDDMAMGALLACEAAGRKADIIVCGVDAIADAMEAVKEGRLDFTIFQDAHGIGAGSCEVAYKLAKGESVEKTNYVDFTLITVDNVEQYIGINE